MRERKIRRAKFEVNNRIDSLGKVLGLSSETISEAHDLLSEVIESFPYVYYLEFSLALLYYSTRTHEPLPFQAMMDTWCLHCLKMEEISDTLSDAEKKGLRRYYRIARSRIVYKYYRRIASILGNPPPFNSVEWVLSFIDKVSTKPPFSESKELARKLAVEYPPEKHSRDLISVAGAYLYLACIMQGETMTIPSTWNWLIAQLTGTEPVLMNTTPAQEYSITTLREANSLNVGTPEYNSATIFKVVREFQYSSLPQQIQKLRKKQK